jgi:hypothetical protein
MRLLTLATALFCVSAITPVSAEPVQVADKKPYVLLGTWSCESIAHSVGTWTFTANDDGSIHMKNFFKTESGGLGSFDESYRYDAASGHWLWSSSFANDPGFSENGTAPAWTADSDHWIFDGTVREASVPPVNSIRRPRFSKEDQRMVYTLLDNNVLRRDFEVQRKGLWVTTSASTCKRTETPA